MDNLTRLYKNKYESLLERYNYLQGQVKLVEDATEALGKMPLKDFMKWVEQNPGAAEYAKQTRAKARAKMGLPEEQPSAPKQPKAKQQSTGPKQTSTKDPMPGEPGYEDFIKAKAEEMRKAAQEAKAAEPKATEPKQPSQPEAPKAAEPKTAPEQKLPQAKKGFKMPSKAGIAGFGVGLPAFMLGDVLTQKALEAAGVENQVAKEIPGSAVGGAVADVAGLATTSVLSGAGLPTAAALGGAALKGGLAGMAFYGGYKAGEALADIELPSGKTVADVGGEAIYDISKKITGGKSAAEQLTTAKTGTVGGDPKQMEKLAQEEEEAKKEEEQRKKEEAAAIAKRVAEIKAGR